MSALTRQSTEYFRNLKFIPREGRPRILRSVMPVSTANTVQMSVHGGVWYTLVFSVRFYRGDILLPPGLFSPYVPLDCHRSLLLVRTDTVLGATRGS